MSVIDAVDGSSTGTAMWHIAMPVEEPSTVSVIKVFWTEGRLN